MECPRWELTQERILQLLSPGARFNGWLRGVSFVLLHFITVRPESHFITCFPSPSHSFVFPILNLTRLTSFLGSKY